MPTTPDINATDQPVFDVQLQAIAEAIDGNGVAGPTDLEVTDGAGDNESDIAAGTAYYDGSAGSLGTATTKTHSQGDASNDRWDLLAFDVSAGSVVLREGAAEAYPTPPALQAGEVLLAVVYVAASQTDFGQSDIVEWRQPAGAGFDHDHTGDQSPIPNAGLANASVTVSPGTGLANGGSVALGASTTLDIASGGVGRDQLDPVSLGGLGLPNHHIQYAGGLADEEITRFQLPAGEALEVYGLDLELKGGGSDTSLELDIYDVDNSSVVASTTAGTRSSGSPIGTSGSGATILVRLTTGSSGPYTLAASGQINVS